MPMRGELQSPPLRRPNDGLGAGRDLRVVIAFCLVGLSMSLFVASLQRVEQLPLLVAECNLG